MREYEALLILPARLDDEAVKKTMQTVSDEIAKLGGSVDGYDVIGKKVFARMLKKQNAGTYVKMKFELAADAVATLLSRLKFNADVFRIQITQFDPIVAAAKAAAKAAAALKREALAASAAAVTAEATVDVEADAPEKEQVVAE